MGDHTFICYAREDEDFVLKLAANLKKQGVPVWLDQWDIPPSADWDQTIDNAICDCANFLIVLSQAAVTSQEVRGELRVALDENKPTVPVLYRTCRIPRQLRLIECVDFTCRDPSDRAALEQVLRALGVFRLKPGEFEPEMILIPAGEFTMGTDPKKMEVYLPDYHLAKTPVTNAQYAAFVQAAGYRPPRHWWAGNRPPTNKEDHPAVYVSWYDAVAYCRWLSRITGKLYRLPSETEWEKGARGIDGRSYPWGNKWNKRWCNSVERGRRDTTPVGEHPRGVSPYGLLDMAGNVWEWTCSIWKDYPDASAGVCGDPDAIDRTTPFVLRGGAFDRNQKCARCTARFNGYLQARHKNRGFRVLSPSGSEL